MKKPILAAVGLAGACVACCSIPIALTLVSGLSAAGLAGWVVGDLTGPIAAAGLGVMVIGGVWAWRVRRANADCATQAAPSCSTGAGSCGCAAKAG